MRTRLLVLIALIPLLVLACGRNGAAPTLPPSDTKEKEAAAYDPGDPPTDLHAEMVDGKLTVYWREANMGDYNGDGVVSGLDIFPLAAHFLENSNFNGQTADTAVNDCIDSNMDGVLNGLDLFPVATHFNDSNEGFNLYRSIYQNGGYEKINTSTIERAAGSPGPQPPCFKEFSYVDESYPAKIVYYKVTSVRTAAPADESERSDWTSIDRRVGPPFNIDYVTLFGGSEYEQAREVIPFIDGRVLIGMQTMSSDMWISGGAYQDDYAGDDPGLGDPGIYGGDCFIAIVGEDGSTVDASTYFGGSAQERNVYGMEIDAGGDVYIASMTRSDDLPTTTGAYQEDFAGGDSDWMVARLSADLTDLVWCTYVGGDGSDSPRGGLALDPAGGVFVVGTTASTDFPTTDGAYQRTRKGDGDAAVVKLSADGSSLEWASLFGGDGDEVAMGARVAANGDLVIGGHTSSANLPVSALAPQPTRRGGWDMFWTRFRAAGNGFVWSTFLGGSAGDFGEHRVFLLDDESALLAGVTNSSNFPTTPEAYQRTFKSSPQGTLTRINSSGSGWGFSTFFGGTGGESLWLSPVVDRNGLIFMVGATMSDDLPVTDDALQSEYGGGFGDGAIVAFSADGSEVVYCSYLGGAGEDIIHAIAFGEDGQVFLVGTTDSADFPTTTGAFQENVAGDNDAFVVRLSPDLLGG